MAVALPNALDFAAAPPENAAAGSLSSRAGEEPTFRVVWTI
jgi:hypothetical protein